MNRSGCVVTRPRWEDPSIEALDFPGGTMTLCYGFGSGLATRAGDPPGHLWAIGDRGPDIKVKHAVKRYGRCCQSNANLSLHAAVRALGSMRQLAS